MTKIQKKFLNKFKDTESKTSKTDVRDKVIEKTTFDLEGTTYSVLLHKMFHWGAMQQLGEIKHFNKVQVFEHVEGDDECIPYQIGMTQEDMEDKDFMSEDLKREFRKHLKQINKKSNGSNRNWILFNLYYCEYCSTD